MKPILCLEQPGGTAGATLAALDHPSLSRPMSLSQAELLGALPAVGLLVLHGPGPVAELASLAWRRAGLRSLVWTDDEGHAELLRMQPYLVLLDSAQLGRLTGRPVSPNGGTGSAREAMTAATELIETGPLVVAVALKEGDLLLVSPLGAWRAVLPPASAPNDPEADEPTELPAEPFELGPELTSETAGRLLAGLGRGLLLELPPAEILRLAVAVAAGQQTQAVRVSAVR